MFWIGAFSITNVSGTLCSAQLTLPCSPGFFRLYPVSKAEISSSSSPLPPKERKRKKEIIILRHINCNNQRGGVFFGVFFAAVTLQGLSFFPVRGGVNRKRHSGSDILCSFCYTVNVKSIRF